MNIDLNLNFKSNLVKQWFNDNYFIGLYDNNDVLLTVFENTDETCKFLNMPLRYLVQALKNNWGVEYNHKRYRLYVFEKEKDDYLERGKRR